MILLIKISLNQFFLILISFLSIVNNHCLNFKNENLNLNNYCEINQAKNFSEFSFKECLRCYIKFQHIILINQTLNNQCKTNLQCIEFEFYNNTLFENFFQKYFYILKDLFRILNHSQISNTLYIKIEHDDFKELNLEYIQSILKSSGIDYSYLVFILSDYRKEILLNLETNLLKLPLNGIQIQIICDKNTKNIYYLRQYDKSVFHSNNCVTIQLNNAKSFSRKIISITSSTITQKLTINLVLFLAGLIFFSIWILCLCLCLYLRYYKWKNNENFNQRSSIVSSIFSVDSFDSRKDDILLNEQKKQKPSSQYGLYSFIHDF